jgi:hypothetical protein
MSSNYTSISSNYGGLQSVENFMQGGSSAYTQTSYSTQADNWGGSGEKNAAPSGRSSGGIRTSESFGQHYQERPNNGSHGSDVFNGFGVKKTNWI